MPEKYQNLRHTNNPHLQNPIRLESKPQPLKKPINHKSKDYALLHKALKRTQFRSMRTGSTNCLQFWSKLRLKMIMNASPQFSRNTAKSYPSWSPKLKILTVNWNKHKRTSSHKLGKTTYALQSETWWYSKDLTIWGWGRVTHPEQPSK